ncbi:hypothetical protein HDU91_000777 [Kappamyces sp. JEL0680]|nr:hypothetical protein HDU91_000777 [Kappamyces sp. JEL0680]
MSLFDHFEGLGTQPGPALHAQAAASDSLTGPLEAMFESTGIDASAQFVLDKVQFTFPDMLLDVKVESNILAVALKSSKVLWIDLDKPNSILEITIPGGGQLESLFLSPLAQGLIVSLLTGENYFYYPTGPSKPRALSKIKGRISSVAWPPTSLRGSILVGTRGGGIFDLEVMPSPEPKKFEKSCVQVFVGDEAVTGLFYLYAPLFLVVYVCTPSSVFQFIGAKDTISVGSLLLDPTLAERQDMMGTPRKSILRVTNTKSFGVSIPDRLDWLTAAGVFSAAITSTGNKSQGDSTLDGVVIVPYPYVGNKEAAPLSGRRIAS